MITCFMFGNYTSRALKNISSERTMQAVALIEELGGKVHAMYALLGEHDLVFIVNFPDINRAVKASVTLSQYLGIPFTSAPAVTVEEFDALMEEA